MILGISISDWVTYVALTLKIVGTVAHLVGL
jgi:hypothetical protein